MLHVHRSERTDALAAALAGLLAEPPADPLAPDVVAVPTRGVERWLAQRLSHTLGAAPGGGDGVCANVVFPHPGRLVAETVAVGGGVAADEDPWRPERLTWRLLEVIDDCVGQPWCAPLAAHLGAGDGADGAAGGHRRRRRLATAAHLARLFDSYGAARPQLLRDWAAGADTDGADGALPADLGWQAELWRRLRAATDVPSPAERLPAACRQVRDAPELLDLPARLSVFGPTRLSTAALAVLAALGAGREVHLWLPYPSPALWQRVAAAAAGLPAGEPVRRRADPTLDAPRHPLLASLTRDAREMQLQLAAVAADAADEHHPAPPPPDTVLGRLQRALRADEPAADEPADAAAAAGDRTLTVHACHGPARQVEVLRELIVGALADDPTLQPRDVLVMCPDIEAYAPLITATFGEAVEDADAHPGGRLRVRLADRSVRSTNPVADVLATLLELADGRVTASAVLDLLAAPPVRQRFSLHPDDAELLRGWVARAGIRWGLDAEHRARYGLGHVPQNTWRAGMDRILLGAAMDEEDLRWLGLALPLDDVDSADVRLAGRLGELVDRLGDVLEQLTGERPLTAWLSTLHMAVGLLTEVREGEEWQQTQVRRLLDDVAARAGESAARTPLCLADVHALLADELAGRPTRANFRSGAVTMCSLVPMRSVPHRLVCLLGMDDGTFPRTGGVDGDDELARDPCVGERDPRSEDRQLLADAVLAATERLAILYTGADPRTNAPRPPAVPVAEILDAAPAALVVRHPLQPFDARNFTAGALGRPGPFSFDRHALRGARRAARPRTPPEPFLAAPLPAARTAELTLDDLIAFLESPVRAFLRHRLGVRAAAEGEDVSDALAVRLDGLAEWAVGDRLLRARLAGVDEATCVQAEWRRGSLPPRELGRRTVAQVMGRVSQLVAAAEAVRAGPGQAVDVVVTVNDAVLTGTVPGVHGTTLVRTEYSKLSAKHRLRAWAQLLALTAAAPGREWRAVTIGRDRSGAGAAVATLPTLSPQAASDALARLLELRATGLCAPLPFAVRTAEAYAAAALAGRPEAVALARARDEWKWESDDDEHRLVWGAGAQLPEVRGFTALARRVWEPVLAAERQQ